MGSAITEGLAIKERFSVCILSSMMIGSMAERWLDTSTKRSPTGTFLTPRMTTLVPK